MMNTWLIATTFAAIVLLSIVTSGRAALCQIGDVRRLSGQQSMGGWRAADHNDGGIATFMTAAVRQMSSSNNAVRLSEGKHVIEAYSQVVAGKNYCIRFSAAGSCGDYHCKSFECVASGHQPLQSQDFANLEVECNEQQACDIDEKRKLSENSMPGGWFKASNDDRVQVLHETASAIANVEKGSVVEAYYQVVAGKNYCVRFNAKATRNCGNNCKSLTCTARGFDPLPHEQTKANLMTSIGVECHSTATLLGSSPMNNSAGRRMSEIILIGVFSALAAIVLV